MNYSVPNLQQLLESGVHFGHQVRRGNPKMRPYIYGARDGVQIIDLTLSEKYLNAACQFVYNLGKSGGVLLFVGTKKQAKPIVEELVVKAEAPYLSERWIGGFLTNFEEVFKNIKKLKDLKEKQDKGELKKYTKKEQLLLSRKIAKSDRDFKGVFNLTGVPDALFVIDTVKEGTAVREANQMGIKVVAIADSNSDPSLIDWPIPGNDDAIKSIRMLTQTIASAYGEGKKAAGKIAQKAKDNEMKKAEANIIPGDIVSSDVSAAEEEVEKETVQESERKV